MVIYVVFTFLFKLYIKTAYYKNIYGLIVCTLCLAVVWHARQSSDSGFRETVNQPLPFLYFIADQPGKSCSKIAFSYYLKISETTYAWALSAFSICHGVAAVKKIAYSYALH